MVLRTHIRQLAVLIGKINGTIRTREVSITGEKEGALTLLGPGENKRPLGR